MDLDAVRRELAGFDPASVPAGELGAVLAELRRVSAAADAALVRTAGRADRARVWESEGFGGPAGWVAARTRLTRPAAAGVANAARRLCHVPELAAAFGEGDVGLDHVVAVTGALRTRRRCAAVTGRPDAIFTTLAREADAHVVRRAVTHWLDRSDPDGAAKDEESAYQARYLSASASWHGNVYLNGQLHPEAGETLLAALRAAAGGPPDPDDERTAGQRRADALVDIARYYLDNAPTGTHGGGRPHVTLTADLPSLLRWRYYHRQQQQQPDGGDTWDEAGGPAEPDRQAHPAEPGTSRAGTVNPPDGDNPDGASPAEADSRPGQGAPGGHGLGEHRPADPDGRVGEPDPGDPAAANVPRPSRDTTPPDGDKRPADASHDRTGDPVGTGGGPRPDGVPDPTKGEGPGPGDSDSYGPGFGGTDPVPDVLWAGNGYGFGLTATFPLTGPVTRQAALRILCDAKISRLVTDGTSEVLDLGRTVRTATDAQKRALAWRDQHCVYPGCRQPPWFCDAHHLREWLADDGPTDLDDLALVCRRHHRRLHEHGEILHRTETGDLHLITPAGSRPAGPRTVTTTRPPRPAPTAARRTRA